MLSDMSKVIQSIPDKVQNILNMEEEIKELARIYKDSEHALYLGRGYNYPVALEGALKLKEISYIHAEGYPAAEMKHGPIALINKDMPVVFIATQDKVYGKILSNIEEVKSRGGRVIAIATEGDGYIAEKGGSCLLHTKNFRHPDANPLCNPASTAGISHGSHARLAMWTNRETLPRA